MKHILSLFLLSVCFFLGCKKDKDQTDPVITIFSPATGQVFNVFDTVHLDVKVSDESKLTAISVVLQDSNNVNAMLAVQVPIQSKSFQFQLDYILGEIHLNSGDYKITVIAQDGYNTKSTSKTIYINAVPLSKKYFYFATETGNSATITRYDSVFANPQQINFPGKFVALESSSWYQRLFVAGEVNADFDCYKTIDNQVAWSVHDMGAGYPYFSALGTDGKNAVAGYMDGRLISYDNSGNNGVNYQTSGSTYYPEFIYISGSYCYAGMKDKLSSGKSFRKLNRSVGNQIFQTGVSWSVAGMADRSSSQVYIVGNDNNNQAVLNIFDANSNSFYSPGSLPAGSAISGAGVDPDYFLIAHSDGNIYRYTYSTNSTVSIYSGIVASKISYNKTFNELYVSQGNIFYIFNMAPYALQLKQSFTHSGNIDDFEVVFNR